MLSILLSMSDTKDKKDKILFIYDNYYSLMAHTVRLSLPNSTKKDIDDIVQDTMVNIIEYLDNIDISDTVGTKTLCVLIAKRRAIDHMRLKDNQTLSLEDVFTHEPHDTYTPDIQYTDMETMDIIIRAIDSLDDTYRESCRLKYINGLKEKQIAKILGISPKAVGMRIVRGRKILQEVLRKELYNE